LGEDDRLKVKGYTNPSRFEVFVELLLSLGQQLHPAKLAGPFFREWLVL